jgi:PKD repeat protein
MATVKYDAAGTLLWSHSAFPSAQAYGLNIGSDSGVYVVGGGIVVVGQPAQTVLRYSPTGLANQAPIARATATPSAGAAPLNVTFSAAGSSDPDGTIASYTWNFGDGTTSSAPNPVHAYAAGSFSATLTVQDTLGASNTSAPVAINASAQPARPVSLALTSSSVVGTSSTMATLTLSSTSGATVRLASSNTKVATVPASVVVPAGAKTAVFSVKTARVSRATTVTISATANAVTTRATLSVKP